MSVLGANVSPDRPLPSDGAIQIGFDRYLLPSTVVRQSFALVDAFGAPVSPVPLVTYDPTARVVTIASPNPPGQVWLEPGQPYQLVLGIAEANSDLGGIRAIDRSTLDPASRRVYGFMAAAPRQAGTGEPAASFCSDVLPVFVAKCATGACHGNAEAASAGLALGTSTGVVQTAIARVARGANTGPIAGRGAPPSRRFGEDMPIVDPGNPGNSWLMYKVLLAPLPSPLPTDAGAATLPVCANGATLSPPFTPLAPFLPQPSAFERGVLSDYVLGREMPYPLPSVTGYSVQALTFDERERVRLWIAQGAAVPECGACQ